MPPFNKVSAFEKSAVSGERLRRISTIAPAPSKMLIRNGGKPEGAHLAQRGKGLSTFENSAGGDVS
jgi:hypothetical protein